MLYGVFVVMMASRGTKTSAGRLETGNTRASAGSKHRSCQGKKTSRLGGVTDVIHHRRGKEKSQAY